MAQAGLTYGQAFEWIHSLERFGIKPGLSRIRQLCALLGNPQEKLRFIHVAGTNGKGSTSTMIAEICRAAGHRTGLYTSPYVLDFRERIQIDGAWIPKENLCAGAAQLQALLPLLAEPLTEFECITALALAYFAKSGCDVVVLEVGLGGRWDATNVIASPLCAVLTKISLDHTQLLGGTVEEIALEKCGILKPGCPAVSCCEQPQEAHAVIAAKAKELGCPLVIAERADCDVLRSDLCGSDAVLYGLPVRVPLLGEHMCRNALTAVKTARLLESTGKFSLPEEAIRAGIANAKMPARMEVLLREPLILLDGGHNPDCAGALAAVLARFLPERPVLALCGMMADKDVGGYLRRLTPQLCGLIACRPDIPRALESQVLANEALLAAGERAFYIKTAAAPEEGLRLALQWQAEEENGVLLLCGSFYLASALRSKIMASL
ncbi:MAG: bifunctional folylpolyglutamate synthase/dihydrofolate synthase [Oscillospiraceae bacterium]|nr:bifunctional folylpolyglutamate synthase/dihydrofolate synthase [Oscillospiraceae bacterium]